MIRIAEHFENPDELNPIPLFSPGDLVAHRRYGYRGVVVHVDRSCKADPIWYMANQTQPDRRQPWYHVLVDGSSHATYAAQSNLQPDTTGKPVWHPLVSMFFGEFANGRHERNDEPWPSV